MKNKGVLLFGSICLALLLIEVLIPTSAASKGFPERTITWIVTYTPGGGFDTYSRAIARVMPRYLPKKVNIIIKNLPGAGGRRGTATLYRSRPDGHTIGMINFPGVLVAQQIMKTAYDIDKFTYIGLAATAPYVISVPKNSPFRTVKDLQKAKNPVKFSTTGKGGTGYVAARIATDVLKIPAQFITGYKGSTGCIVGAIRGDVDAVIEGNVHTHLPYIKAGDLRPIVVFVPKRDEFLPDTPTAQELGYDGGLSQLLLQRLIAAPPGTPKNVAKILEEALKRSLEDQELRKWSVDAKRPLKWASAEEVNQIIARFAKLLEQYKQLFAE